MKYVPVLSLSLLLLVPASVRAQGLPAPGAKSAKKALALSLLVPGLGHRYVHGGDWDGSATFYALADAGLWLGLLGTEHRRAAVVSDYETFAAAHAGADVAGKDRQFFLNLGSYHSSDEFLEVALRNRAWDQIDYVAERTNQWEWETESDFQQFRAMREDAETLRRRRSLAIGLLAANRLLSGFSALRAANRTGDAGVVLSLAPAPESRLPLMNLKVQF